MNQVKPTLHERVARILLVEDNPGDILLTRHALKQAKISNQLVIATTGEEAIAMLKREDEHQQAQLPDIVLLDLNLPGISGHEVLTFIKNDVHLQHIQVIILSSSNAESDISKSKKAQVNGYLTKPLNVDNLSKILNGIDNLWFNIVVLGVVDN